MKNHVKNHVMIDCETLGLSPRSLLRSVEAVVFDPQNGTVIKSASWKINMADSLNAGFIIEAATLKFWLMETDEARKAFVSGKEYTISQFVSSFTHFFESLKGETMVYSLQADFDMGFLRSYFMANAMRKNRDTFTLPFDRTCIFDVRNYLRYLQKKGIEITRSSAKHDPHNDCIWQIQVIKQYIQNGGNDILDD